MTDYEDDWWNPSMKPTHWSYFPQDKTEFLIERARKLPCFGNPGYIVEWVVWSVHESSAERDKAMIALFKEHPTWRLRGRMRNPWQEYMRGGRLDDPFPGINAE